MSKKHKKHKHKGALHATQVIPTRSSTDRQPSKLYLAYGSNLDVKAMAHRAPDAVPLGKSAIREMRLVFRHVADITDAPGMRVPVGVWRISPRDERALDMYEGVKAGLYRKIMVRIDGEVALSYRMNDRGIMAPSESYLATIRRGYGHFELDEAALDEALDHAVAQYSPSDMTWARYRARSARERAKTKATTTSDRNWWTPQTWELGLEAKEDDDGGYDAMIKRQAE
jgi:AIG2-like family